MRKLIITLAALALIYVSARAADVTNIFQMPATTCTNQFIRSITTITGAGTCATVVASTDISGLGGYATISAGVLTNSLAGNVALNNTSNYFAGPVVVQGSTGTWCVSGTVSLNDTAVASIFLAKLWDGTTIISSGTAQIALANGNATIALSGCLAAPAGNLRIDVKDLSATTGRISANDSLNAKDSTITAWRVQ